MNEEILNKIDYEYSQMRADAERRKNQNIEKIYKEFPKINKIDEEIKKAGLDNMYRIMTDPENSEKANSEFQKKLKELIKKRTEILKECGVDKNFDKPKYKCSKCNDTGYIDGKKCVCLTEKIKEEEYRTSDLGGLMKKQNFESFDLSLYSSKKDENGESVRSRMSKILKTSKQFCENFDKIKKNMLFYGNPGLGKTFLSSCISKYLIDKGKDVFYIRSSKLFSVYDDNKFGNSYDKSDTEEIIKKIYNCDLLIIDDLGTEFLTKSSLSFFFDFFEERSLKNKKMIISTNFTLKKIEEVYTNRIASRIYENFILLNFKGEDLRIKKFFDM